MGIASTGGSIGNVILPLFTLWCVETYQWRGSFILLGAVCLQGVIAGVLFYNRNRSKKREVVKENTTGVLKLPSLINGFHHSAI